MLKWKAIGLGWVALIGLSASSWADSDRIEHFEGEPAQSLEAALRHWRTYNARLEALLNDKAITAETSFEVHRLTYTLENALSRLDQELDALQATLERVHLASEANRTDVLRDQARQYLEHSARLLDASPASTPQAGSP